ncbi:GH11316 [Drosophila grimshawi]|uniref:GH11316 n=1 Tax=Drosophila grimshawi TaxID=7222 RepID=B4K3V6_DROGR|nr:GH11316 [Drosophila grimshawi]
MRTPRTLVLLLIQVIIRCEAAPIPNVIAALQQIPKLSYGQLSVLDANSMARCNLIPQLCDWQLHLYEGHSFSVHMPNFSPGVIGELESNAVHTTTTTTTERPSILLRFEVSGLKKSDNLLIYAQVEGKATDKFSHAYVNNTKS